MTSIEIPRELKVGLDAIRERDGVLQSEQIRRAIGVWLEMKGFDPETGGERKTKPRK